MDPIMELAAARRHHGPRGRAARTLSGGVVTMGRAGWDDRATSAPSSLHESRTVTSLGVGGVACDQPTTAFGPQLSLARFVGLDISKQIKNWLYDVVPLETARGSPCRAITR